MAAANKLIVSGCLSLCKRRHGTCLWGSVAGRGHHASQWRSKAHAAAAAPCGGPGARPCRTAHLSLSAECCCTFLAFLFVVRLGLLSAAQPLSHTIFPALKNLTAAQVNRRYREDVPSWTYRSRALTSCSLPGSWLRDSECIITGWSGPVRS